jgi:hypothetical protein
MTIRLRLIAEAVTAICLLVIAIQVRRRQMRASYLVIWTSMCLIAIPLIAVPGAVEDVSSWLGIYYPPATIFVGAIVILFLVSVHFSRQLTRLEERTRILAEELALLRVAGAPPQLMSLGGEPEPSAGTREAQDATARGDKQRH